MSQNLKLELEYDDSRDRSMTECSFSNSKKYLVDDNADLPVHDISLATKPVDQNNDLFIDGNLSKTNLIRPVNDEHTLQYEKINNQSLSVQELGSNTYHNEYKHRFIDCHNFSSLCEKNSNINQVSKNDYNDNVSKSDASVCEKVPSRNVSKNKISSSHNRSCEISNPSTIFSQTFMQTDTIPDTRNMIMEQTKHQIETDEELHFKFPENQELQDNISLLGSKNQNMNNISSKDEASILDLESSQSDEHFLVPVKPSENVNNQRTDSTENKIGVQRKYFSTFNLKDVDSSLKSVRSNSFSRSHSHLSKNKSYSLNNLSVYKTPNYSHVKSKVKQYIQERKREETCKKENEKIQSKSLPVSPLKKKRSSIYNDGLLRLDEHLIENLSTQKRNEKAMLPEELKRIKDDIHNGKADLELVENLFIKLLKEREHRIDQDITLNVLQLHYDNLLVEYAQAKNVIDNLRFYNINNSKVKEEKNLSKFKKAFSTSNILSACAGVNSIFPVNDRSNLVRYSSSPLVDPSVYSPISVKEMRGEHHSFQDLKSSKIACSTSDSHLHSLGDISVSEWLEKCEYLKQKYTELFHLYQTCSEQALRERNCKQKFEEIKQAVEILYYKYFSDKEKEVSSYSTKGEYHIGPNIPTNNSYPKLINQPVEYDYNFKTTLPKQSSDSPLREKVRPSFKHGFQRDVDSGCPPSDRSTRNSQQQSFDQSDMWITAGFVPEPESSQNHINDIPLSSRFEAEFTCDEKSLNLSSIKLGFDEQARKSQRYSRSSSKTKTLRYSLPVYDEDYDASCSSDSDVPYRDCEMKRFLKKKPFGSGNSPHKKLIEKYEDKFVCRHHLNRPKGEKSCLKYEPVKNHNVGLSRIEKNSRYFEMQVKDLKTKGLQKRRKDNCRLSLPNRPSTPWKVPWGLPLSTADVSSNLNYSPSINSAGKDEQAGNLEANAVYSEIEDVLAGTGKTGDSQVRELKNMKKISHLIPPVPDKSRKFSTSTPKSKDIFSDAKEVTKSPFSSPSHTKLDKKSRSVPSVNKLSHMDRATGSNCPEQLYKCSKKLQNNTSFHRYFSDQLRENDRRHSESYLDNSSIMAFLEEATAIAESVRGRCRNVQSVLQTDLLSVSRP